MSNQTRISKLNTNIKKRISWVLRQNGFMNEDIELILSKGKVKDISDFIDMEEFA